MTPKPREFPYRPASQKVVLAALLLAGFAAGGCTMNRSALKQGAAVGIGGAAGGALAHELSDGNVGITALGAAGGAVLGHVAMHDDREAVQSGFDQGYVQGQSDAIKRQYFLRHSLEKKPLLPNEGGETVYYTLPLNASSGSGSKEPSGAVTVKVIE